MSEIKPCPFCGSKAGVQTSIRFEYVSCQNPKCDSFGPNGLDEYEAIRAWNQRPYDYDMPAIVKKVQQLEKLIGELQVEFEMIQEMAAEDIRLGWAMHTSLYQIETNSNAAIKKAAGVLCKQPE